MEKPELLAPAGDFEKLRTALHYGADAVYIGDSRFSLRGKAGNFHHEELKGAVEYAHAHNARVYVTANIFAHNRDLKAVEDHILLLGEIRPDAVIVSDPGIFTMFRRIAPEIDIHISTQANITNTETAKFWEGLGARRLILARELSVEEIGEIRQKTSIELEVFVHGSICISYSGRCYISSFLASRSANAGKCTNSCRWNYALMEEKRQGEYLPVLEDERGTYIMSSRDLCMIDHLPLLAEAGVSSFKIEGRMKGINYVAGVVKTYREAVDAIGKGDNPELRARWHRELSMFSSRGYTTGMFFGKQPDADYNFDGESYRMSHELVGVVLEVTGNSAKVALRNRLDEGDPVEFLSPGLEGGRFAAESIRNAEGVAVTSARNEEIIFLKVPDGVRENDLIRRNKDFRGALKEVLHLAGDTRQ
ncbi:MAG: U32 family peptidase [Nitrospirota bacterium]|nr:U32 family peptidase [Nitrospirota bacterium]